MVTKPVVGGSVGTWGQILNDGLDDLQQQIIDIPITSDGGLSAWEVLGGLASITVTGDSGTGVWTVLGALGATVTLEG